MEVLEKAYVSSSYGTRNGKLHTGVDLLSNVSNRKIYCPARGKVIKVINEFPDNQHFSTPHGGNEIWIEHGNGYISRYCHLKFNSITVKYGDIVEEGTVIAEEGESGYAFGVHLHFEVWKDGNYKYVDPTNFGLGKEQLPGYEEEKKEVTQYLNLSPKADTWRIYPLDKEPVVGNECGYAYPSKFNGLSYTILRYTMPTVAVIKTRDWGEVQIYIAHELASITDQPIYGLVN